jgi:hypothetical protein
MTSLHFRERNIYMYMEVTQKVPEIPLSTQYLKHFFFVYSHNEERTFGILENHVN